MRRCLLLVVTLTLLALMPVAAEKRPAFELGLALSRAGEYVTAYFARAQSIICEESVRLQTLGWDLMPDGTPPRVLRYDLRVAWEPAPDGGVPEAHMLRTLLSINNRRPPSDDGNERKQRKNENDACMDPKAISPEPLSVFLPEHQSEYEFTAAGRGKVNGRAALMIDARERDRGPITSSRRGECVSWELPGRLRSRIWVDEDTAEVLRIDEHLVGVFDLDIPPDPEHRLPQGTGVLERYDSSVIYRRMTFAEPDETLMLPVSKETMVVFRNIGKDRVRTSESFANYRRFLTGGRVVQ
jgi:hypothetical protein